MVRGRAKGVCSALAELPELPRHRHVPRCPRARCQASGWTESVVCGNKLFVNEGKCESFRISERRDESTGVESTEVAGGL